MASYVPAPGDIVWLHFDPQTGREQAGHRPAVVLSPTGYNAKTGLMLCCPLTTRIKGYPFEVSISGSTASVALADQIKSFDWRIRQARFKGQVTTKELAKIHEKAGLLLGSP